MPGVASATLRFGLPFAFAPEPLDSLACSNKSIAFTGMDSVPIFGRTWDSVPLYYYVYIHYTQYNIFSWHSHVYESLGDCCPTKGFQRASSFRSSEICWLCGSEREPSGLVSLVMPIVCWITWVLTPRNNATALFFWSKPAFRLFQSKNFQLLLLKTLLDLFEVLHLSLLFF